MWLNSGQWGVSRSGRSNFWEVSVFKEEGVVFPFLSGGNADVMAEVWIAIWDHEGGSHTLRIAMLQGEKAQTPATWGVTLAMDGHPWASTMSDKSTLNNTPIQAALI